MLLLVYHMALYLGWRVLAKFVGVFNLGVCATELDVGFKIYDVVK
jgi:hypothetical protein